MVFTLVNAVLFRPVAVQGGERLVAIMNEKHTGRNSETGVSYPDFRDYRTQASSLESLEATTGEEAVLSEQGNPPQAFSMERVTSGLFDMLHTSPALGRSFTASDDRPGAEPVILLGYGIWKDRYAKDPNIAWEGTTPFTGPWRLIILGFDKDHLQQSETFRDMMR